ncbi:MAG: hypothetical protein FWF33_01155 [Clostridiales bacterium]|nr:hypothetical protein [Clostridiales bacterium]
MSKQKIAAPTSHQRPRPVVAIVWLVGVYIALTWVSAAAAIALANAPSAGITTEAVVHAAILAIVSVLTLVFTINLYRGRPRAGIRIRIIGIILMVALIVTAIVLPLPGWMIVGHYFGAALLLVVVFLSVAKANPA